MTTTFKAQKIDCFRRAESNRKSVEEFKVYCVPVVLETTVSMDELIRLVGFGGSHRSGVFEIQTSEGIIRHINDKKIDNRTPRKRANILFKTWDEMEQEENDGGDVNWTQTDSIVS